MCSLTYFDHRLGVYTLCLFVSIYFSLLNPYFKGLGGKLGSIAFVSGNIVIIVFSLISLISAWLTFYLIKKPNVTPTRASSVVSLLGVFLVFLINRLIAIDIDFYCLLIFGASFVGMCSSKRVKDFEVVFAAVVFTAVYIKISPQISHLGGAKVK